MFEQQHLVAERSLDPLSLALKEPRPVGVVVNDLDRSDQWYEHSELRSPDLLLSQWNVGRRPSLLWCGFAFLFHRVSSGVVNLWHVHLLSIFASPKSLKPFSLAYRIAESIPKSCTKNIGPLDDAPPFSSKIQ